MKKKYYIATAITSYLLFLIATIPAEPVISLINETPVTIKNISGTLWNGKAYAVSINNKVQLTNTQWSFNVWKLLIGQIAADIKTEYSENSINSEVGVSIFGGYFVNNLTARISAEDIASLADIPIAQLSGMVALNIDYVHWKQGELPMASGQITWNDATVSVADSASLGNVLITLGESENQLLSADIKNQGGDIAITGTADLVPEASYEININLSPTASANDNIKQSLAMFARKQANGSYLFKQSGQLSEIGLL